MFKRTFKIILILSLLAVYCFAFQGKRGLFEPDEGRYSAVALQMIKSGDWLHPHTHPEHAHWAKPPLTYWAIAASLLTFGHNEFAVRFPNALAFLVTVITSFFLGGVFVPRRPWIVPLVFATFLFPATVCNGATTDYLLTMWETMAVCFFARAYWGKNEKERLYSRWLMWAAFGLAFLTKGPPGLFPLLAIILFVRSKQGRKHPGPIPWARGIVLMLLIGGSWFFWIITENSAMIRYFFWDEIVLRFFTGRHERHPQWYAFLYIYVPVLVFGSLPWIYFSGKGLTRSIKTARGSSAGESPEDSSKTFFLLLWFFVPLTVFVLSQSNLPLYVLPSFAPLAVITAIEIERSGFPLEKFRYGIAAWCAGLVLVRVVMSFLPFKADSSRLAEEIKKYHPSPVKEMVFVNSVPALGLQFYTGADIKGVSLESPGFGDAFREKKSRLWFVPLPEADQFRSAAGEHHVKMVELGNVQSLKNYVFFQEVAADIMEENR